MLSEVDSRRLTVSVKTCISSLTDPIRPAAADNSPDELFAVSRLRELTSAIPLLQRDSSSIAEPVSSLAL